MWKFVLVLVLVAAGAMPCHAQSRDPAEYVRTCPVPVDPAYDACTYTAAHFADDLAAAWRGEYQGIRNVSFCLETGCEGAIKLDKREGCAWRAIAYGLAPTGDDKILEAGNMKAHCTGTAEIEVKAFLDAIVQNGFDTQF